MADKGPSALTAAGTLDGTEIVHLIQSSNSRKATLDDILGVDHAHAIADVTGLQAALDDKIDDSQAAAGGLAVLGAANAAAVRAAAGLVIGTDVQAFDATLMPPEWVPNFTSDGDVYIAATEAMTIDQGNAEIGTGTIAYEKSTTAAPGTFSSTTLPAALQAGAWLKVSASGVTGFVATHLVRTA